MTVQQTMIVTNLYICISRWNEDGRRPVVSLTLQVFYSSIELCLTFLYFAKYYTMNQIYDTNALRRVVHIVPCRYWTKTQYRGCIKSRYAKSTTMPTILTLFQHDADMGSGSVRWRTLQWTRWFCGSFSGVRDYWLHIFSLSRIKGIGRENTSNGFIMHKISWIVNHQEESIFQHFMNSCSPHYHYNR